MPKIVADFLEKIFRFDGLVVERRITKKGTVAVARLLGAK